MLAAGCGQSVSTIDPPPVKTHSGEKLTIRCSSSVRHPELLEQFAAEWAERTGASIEILKGDQSEKSADIVIVAPAELPALAEAGTIQALPPSFMTREHDNQYHWDGLLRTDSQVIASWGRRAIGIPLLGEGRVMVYRPDRLEAAKLAVPETWDDYIAAARAIAKDGRPSLPPLPARADDLDVEFHQIAACCDGHAIFQSEGAKSGDNGEKADPQDVILSYHYRFSTAQPRIDAPAFIRALELLRDMRPFRAPGQSERPTDAFRSGQASLCIADLEDVARFQQEGSPVRGRFRIAPIPGSRMVYNLDGKEKKLAAVNRLPYIGARGWIGAVASGRSDDVRAVAMEFLTEFAHPERMGAEVITAAKWGAGPYRSQHLEERTRGLWYGYDLPPKETEALLRALKEFKNPSLINHRYRLRIPNQAAHLEAFDALVRPSLLAETADAKKTLVELKARWDRLWEGIPDAQRRRWIQLGYGAQSGQ